jgi:hypothetical protein
MLAQVTQEPSQMGHDVPQSPAIEQFWPQALAAQIARDPQKTPTRKIKTKNIRLLEGVTRKLYANT